MQRGACSRLPACSHSRRLPCKRHLIAACAAFPARSPRQPCFGEGYGRGSYDGTPMPWSDGHAPASWAPPPARRWSAARAMYPSKDIVDNAVQLDGPHHPGRGGQGGAAWSARLKSPGPFTVFAPTNSGVLGAARRHRRHAAEAGEQGHADARSLHLPRGAGPHRRAPRSVARSIQGRRRQGASLKTASGGTLSRRRAAMTCWSMRRQGHTTPCRRPRPDVCHVACG